MKQHYVMLRDAAPEALAWSDFLWSDACGHSILAPEERVDRRSALGVHAAEGLDEVLKRVGTSFADTGYTSHAVVAARLNNVSIDLMLGLCVTSDGILISETAAVADAIDPGFGTSALLAGSVAGLETHDVPVLHLFHRSSPAFGHFLLDCLVPLRALLPAIRAGRLDVLLPPFAPAWMRKIMVWFGVPKAAIWAPDGGAARCRQVVLLSAMATHTTFNPNPTLCRSAALTAIGLVRPPCRAQRFIYLSRARQISYSQRALTNEGELQAFLAARGFEILEPGNMPFAEQVRAFAEAEVIVGAHGSGFGNLIFARPGTVVIDLMPSDWPGYWNIDPPAERWLLNLTSAMDLAYELVLCRSRLVRMLDDGDTSGRQKFGMETDVDLPLLAQVLDGLASGKHAGATALLRPPAATTPGSHGSEGLQTQIATMFASTSWRLTAALRKVAHAVPGLARLPRRALRILWWTVTMQLPARLAERRRRAERQRH